MSERLDRLDSDARLMRIWQLGAVLHDPAREWRIRAAQNWHRLMTPQLEEAREIYAQWVAPNEPLSDISGYRNGVPFHVTRDQLRAVWRESRKKAS